MQKNKLALLFLLLANIIFGFSFLFAKVAFDTVPPMVALAIRFSIAFILLNLLVVFRLAKLRLGGKDLRGLLLLSLLEPLLYFICESYGIALTTSSFSGAVIALIPVAVMALGAFFLKEVPTKWQVLAMLCSIAGVIMISVGGSSDGTVTLLGFALLVGAVLCSAGYTLLSRKYSQHFTAFDRTYVTFGVATLGFLLLALVQYRGDFLPLVGKALSSPSFLGAIAYLSAISSVGAFLMLNFALSHVSVTVTASFNNLITLVSVLAGVLLLGEPFSLLQFTAVALILLGVYGVNKLGARPDAPQSHPIPPEELPHLLHHQHKEEK